MLLAIISESRPWRLMLPLMMMPTWSTIISMSCRIWLEKKMVLPCSCRARIRSRNSLRPMGSSPENGSSRIRQIGVLDQGLGHAQALDHALGEFAQFQVLVAAQPHLVDQSRSIRSRATAAGQVEQRGREIQQFAGAEVIVKIGVFGQKTDLAAGGDGMWQAGR